MVRVSRLLLACMVALLVLGTRGVRADVPPPIRIMPLGDSITSSIPGQVSYRYWLWNTMVGAGYSVDFVGSLCGVYKNKPPLPCPIDWDGDHEGYFGKTTDYVRDNMVTDSKPDWVLIHLGHNDLWLEENDDINTVINRTISELGQIIDELRLVNPNVKVLLAKIIPAHPSLDDTRLGYIPEFNAKIPTLAASKTSSISPVRVVDQFTGFDPTADLVDLVHPDESGEKKMAERWFAIFNVMMRGFPVAYLPIVLR